MPALGPPPPHQSQFRNGGPDCPIPTPTPARVDPDGDDVHLAALDPNGVFAEGDRADDVDVGVALHLRMGEGIDGRELIDVTRERRLLVWFASAIVRLTARRNRVVGQALREVVFPIIIHEVSKMKRTISQKYSPLVEQLYQGLED